MEPYPWEDVEWVALDREGRVAVFTTGGAGPVPRAFLRAPGTLQRIREAIWALPEISESDLLVTLPHPDDFEAFARRGMFVFDWRDVHRTAGQSARYELQARPRTPARIDDLDWPAELRDVIRVVTHPALDFAQSSTDTRDLDCAWRDAV